MNLFNALIDSLVVGDTIAHPIEVKPASNLAAAT